MLEEYVYLPVKFDQKFVLALKPDEMLDNWNQDPAPHTNKQIGDSWIKSRKSVILEVPSAIVPTEKNFLINPVHPAFSKLKIDKPVKLEFDKRLFKP